MLLFSASGGNFCAKSYQKWKRKQRRKVSFFSQFHRNKKPNRTKITFCIRQRAKMTIFTHFAINFLRIFILLFLTLKKYKFVHRLFVNLYCICELTRNCFFQSEKCTFCKNISFTFFFIFFKKEEIKIRLKL